MNTSQHRTMLQTSEAMRRALVYYEREKERAGDRGGRRGIRRGRGVAKKGDFQNDNF